jgi:hypothetical protein
MDYFEALKYIPGKLWMYPSLKRQGDITSNGVQPASG